MIDAITTVLFFFGALLMLIGGLGVLRMPDLPTRMHASSKAGALGGGLMAIAVAVHFEEADVTARALAIAVFIILTSPVAAHAIGRAAYFCGVPLWGRTVRDDLKGRYDPRSHVLSSTARRIAKASEGVKAGDAGAAPGDKASEKAPGSSSDKTPSR